MRACRQCVLAMLVAATILMGCGGQDDGPPEVVPDALRAPVADWFAQTHRSLAWSDVRASPSDAPRIACDGGEQFQYEITAVTEAAGGEELDEQFDLLSAVLTGNRPFVIDEGWEIVSRTDADALDARIDVFRSENDGVTVTTELEPAEDGVIAATFRGETDCA